MSSHSSRSAAPFLVLRFCAARVERLVTGSFPPQTPQPTASSVSTTPPCHRRRRPLFDSPPATLRWHYQVVGLSFPSQRKVGDEPFLSCRSSFSLLAMYSLFTFCLLIMLMLNPRPLPVSVRALSHFAPRFSLLLLRSLPQTSPPIFEATEGNVHGTRSSRTNLETSPSLMRVLRWPFYSRVLAMDPPWNS